MTRGLYARLAGTNLRQNRRLYTPYILTGVCIIAVFYILAFLSADPVLDEIPAGTSLKMILSLGVIVIGVFSVLFLFYTNSFLMKQRKKELGLYNILGMGKRHVGRVLLCESAAVAGISIGGGLFAGILFSKLSELAVLKLMKMSVSFTFSVGWQQVLLTAGVYLAIYLLLLLNSLRQVHTVNPIELFRGGSTGEKEPKANFVLAAAGVLLLGAGYWMAVSVQDALGALSLFFVAVILVILGTYCCFIAGSVVLLKLLRRNQKYYYRADHFISTSSMIYRMKRNGAGLATICILSTMVLVMLSSVTCLMAGQEDAIRARYPRDILTTIYHADDQAVKAARSAADSALRAYGLTAENEVFYRYLSFEANLRGSTAQVANDRGGSSGGDRVQLYFIPLEDYNAATGGDLTLKPGEVYAYCPRYRVNLDSVTVGTRPAYTVKGVLDSFADTGDSIAYVNTTIYFVVPDMAELNALQAMLAQAGSDSGAATVSCYMAFDLDASDTVQQTFFKTLTDELSRQSHSWQANCTAEARTEFYTAFAGLFFLALLLGAAFILAAVLIMYYKQVTEGYEDRARYAILMRVGMTRREIRRSVNSQILTVFFLPLVTAGVHMAFAFPMLSKLLQLFALDNIRLFALVTVISYAVFAVLYTLTYRATSGVYYRLVSSGETV